MRIISAVSKTSVDIVAAVSDACSSATESQRVELLTVSHLVAIFRTCGFDSEGERRESTRMGLVRLFSGREKVAHVERSGWGCGDEWSLPWWIIRDTCMTGQMR